MKAKAPKPKATAAKAAKAPAKKTAKPASLKAAAGKAAAKSAAKGAAAKAAGSKAIAAVKPAGKKPASQKPAVKDVRKSAARPAGKAPAKTPAKTQAKTQAKTPARPPIKIPKLVMKKDASKVAAPAPARGPVRRIPKPASVATRRKEHAHFRDLLLKKRQDLMRAYSISKGDSQSDLDNGTEDYVDYAVNSYAREFLLSLTEMDRKQLLMVEDALNRIDRGEYGYCQQCAEEINRKRLEVQPWARHCVRCQELEEQGLLPQYPFQAGDEDDLGVEPEEAVTLDEEFEPETEVEDEVLDEEPLVVDGDDSEE